MPPTPDIDWTAQRKSAAAPCAVIIMAVAMLQLALAIGLPFGSVMWGGAEAILPLGLRLLSIVYALVCVGSRWIIVQRAASPSIVNKASGWAVCGLSGFAMVVHMESPSVAEQIVMGTATAIIAVMSLFVAFLPDDADMVDNPRLTAPENGGLPQANGSKQS